VARSISPSVRAHPRLSRHADASPHTKLRALAVLFPTVVHIVARRESGIRNVVGLKGRRILVGPRGSPTEGASRAVLESHGLGLADIVPVFDRDHAIEDFHGGRLDGIVLFFPIGHALAVALMRDHRAVLIPMSGAMESIRARPLLKPAWIAKGTYEGQSETVPTVGTDVLLVSHKDLSEDLVYTLTRTLFESVDALGRAHRSARDIDPARGPGAPIPLHRGAVRYYRERELFR
jgi:TRAP transporter TAXI family solute receptor